MAVTISGTTGVGVSTTPLYPSDILIGSIGTTAGAQVIGARLTGTSSNADILDISNVRGTAGTDWTTAGWRLQQKVDATWMGYIQFNGTPNGTNSFGISFGTGSSTVSANSVTERMRIDSSGNVGIANPTPAARLDIGGGTADSVQAIFTRGVSDSNFQIRAVNGVAGSVANTLMGEFGLVYAGTGDAATINFYRGGGATDGALTINTNAVERLRVNATGDLLFNSGYGSAAVAYGCRAWVNFNGAAAGTFTGGTVTVSRVAGSTTCSCTTANAHGLITGGTIYASLGNIVTPPYIPAGFYSVTVTGTNSFTFVNTQTAAIASATLVIPVNAIRGDGNISSVSDLGIGNYALHFSTPMSDTNYAVLATVGWGAFASDAQNDAMPFTGEQTSTYFKLYIQSQPDGTFDPTFIHAAVFR